MRIYATPKEVQKPKMDFMNFGKYREDVKKYVNDIAEFCKKHSKEPLAGKTFSFPVADGKAEYMLLSLKPLKVIHLDIYDEYQYEGVQWMKAKDVVDKINQQEKLNKLFSKKTL